MLSSSSLESISDSGRTLECQRVCDDSELEDAAEEVDNCCCKGEGDIAGRCENVEWPETLERADAGEVGERT